MRPFFVCMAREMIRPRGLLICSQIGDNSGKTRALENGLSGLSFWVVIPSRIRPGIWRKCAENWNFCFSDVHQYSTVNLIDAKQI